MTGARNQMPNNTHQASTALARITDEFDAFIGKEVTTLDQYNEAVERSIAIGRELIPLMRKEKAWKSVSKKAMGEASSTRSQINQLQAEKLENDYIISETSKSPYSALKAYFKTERRMPVGQRSQ